MKRSGRITTVEMELDSCLDMSGGSVKHICDTYHWSKFATTSPAAEKTLLGVVYFELFPTSRLRRWRGRTTVEDGFCSTLGQTVSSVA